MLRLFLARHGQTDGALAARFCGTLDVPLNAQGEAMARALADYYGATPWRAIVASPAERARRTAAPVAARAGLPVSIDPRLREIEYGEWEGLLEHEIAARDAGAFAAWQADPERLAPPGGETARQIADRARAAVEELRARHPDGDVLAVTHKATLRVLVCDLLGIPLRLFRARIAAPPGSVTIVELLPEGPRLLALADVRHLPKEIQPALDG